MFLLIEITNPNDQISNPPAERAGKSQKSIPKLQISCLKFGTLIIDIYLEFGFCYLSFLFYN